MNLDEALAEYKVGSNSRINLQRLSVILLNIQSRMDFKVGARGWCYILEGAPYRLLNKEKFGIVGDSIARCRHKGYLPWDFCVEDGTRLASNIQEPDLEDIEEFICVNLLNTVASDKFYEMSFWKEQDYYIEMLVEKLDIKELFRPICRSYHIPIATGRGWADINQRCKMMLRFKEAQEKYGCRPVLLYAGDFDPAGLMIADKLRKNLMDLSNAVGWIPSENNLIIEKFGLEYDFIINNGLSWIDNLKTSSGKNLANPNHAMYNAYNIPEYIRMYGERKCELNSLVIRPDEGRKLCKDTINKYISDSILKDFFHKQQDKRDKVKDKISELGLPEIYDKLADTYHYRNFEELHKKK